MIIKIQIEIKRSTKPKKECPGKPKPTEAIKNYIRIINQVKK